MSSQPPSIPLSIIPFNVHQFQLETFGSVIPKDPPETLPAELIFAIVHHLSSGPSPEINTLKSLKLVCKSLAHLCRLELFRSVTVKNGGYIAQGGFHRFATILQSSPVIVEYIQNFHLIDAGGTFVNSDFRFEADRRGFLFILSTTQYSFKRLESLSVKLGLIWFRLPGHLRAAFDGWVERAQEVTTIKRVYVSMIGISDAFFSSFAASGKDLETLEMTFDNAFQDESFMPSLQSEKQVELRAKLRVRELRIMKRVPAMPGAAVSKFSLPSFLDFQQLEAAYFGVPAFLLRKVSSAFPAIGPTAKKLTFDLCTPPADPNPYGHIFSATPYGIDLSIFPCLADLTIIYTQRFWKDTMVPSSSQFPSFLPAILPNLLPHLSTLPGLEVLRLMFDSTTLNPEADMALLASLSQWLRPSLRKFELSFVSLERGQVRLTQDLAERLIESNSVGGKGMEVMFREITDEECGSVWMD